MTRNVIFHCPTLTESTFNVHGKYSGSQLASIPITVQPNTTEVWSAPYVDPIPVLQAGNVIGAVDYYLTDQEDRPLNMMKGRFQGTIMLRWPEPDLPAIGTAGAEDQMADLRELYRR